MEGAAAEQLAERLGHRAVTTRKDEPANFIIRYSLSIRSCSRHLSASPFSLPEELQANIVSVVAAQDVAHSARIRSSSELLKNQCSLEKINFGKGITLLSLTCKALRKLAVVHMFEVRSNQRDGVRALSSATTRHCQPMFHLSIPRQFHLKFTRIKFDVDASLAALQSTLGIAFMLPNVRELVFHSQRQRLGGGAPFVHRGGQACAGVRTSKAVKTSPRARSSAAGGSQRRTSKASAADRSLDVSHTPENSVCTTNRARFFLSRLGPTSSFTRSNTLSLPALQLAFPSDRTLL